MILLGRRQRQGPTSLLLSLDSSSGDTAWSRELLTSRVFSIKAIIVGGKLFVVGDALSAIDLSSGATIWSARLPGVARAELALDKGVLYVLHTFRTNVNDYRPTNSTVSAYKATDGTLLWSENGVLGHLVMGDGITLLHNAGSEDPAALLALDSKTGKALWTRTREERGLAAPPLSINGTFVVLYNDFRILIVEEDSGVIACATFSGNTTCGFPNEVTIGGILGSTEPTSTDSLVVLKNEIWWGRDSDRFLIYRVDLSSGEPRALYFSALGGGSGDNIVKLIKEEEFLIAASRKGGLIAIRVEE